MEYKVEGTLTVDDLKEVTLKFDRTTHVTTLLFSSLVSILVSFFFFDGVSPFMQIFIFFLTFFVVVFLLFVYYSWAFKRASVKKSNSLGIYHCLISDEGIKMVAEKGFSFWEWSKVKKIKTSKNIIVIKSFKHGSMLLPKKTFEVVSFMIEKIEKNAN